MRDYERLKLERQYEMRLIQRDCGCSEVTILCKTFVRLWCVISSHGILYLTMPYHANTPDSGTE